MTCLACRSATLHAVFPRKVEHTRDPTFHLSYDVVSEEILAIPRGGVAYLYDSIVNLDLPTQISRTPFADALDKDAGEFFLLADVARDGDTESMDVLLELDDERLHLGQGRLRWDHVHGERGQRRRGQDGQRGPDLHVARLVPEDEAGVIVRVQESDLAQVALQLLRVPEDLGGHDRGLARRLVVGGRGLHGPGDDQAHVAAGLPQHGGHLLGAHGPEVHVADLEDVVTALKAPVLETP